MFIFICNFPGVAIHLTYKMMGHSWIYLRTYPQRCVNIQSVRMSVRQYMKDTMRLFSTSVYRSAGYSDGDDDICRFWILQYIWWSVTRVLKGTLCSDEMNRLMQLKRLPAL